MEDNDLKVGLETQKKDKPYKIAWKVIVLIVLLALLIVSYVFSFSSYYAVFLDKKLDGTFSAKTYYNAKDFDLIVIKPYKQLSDAEVGDIICFETNAERGSGLFISKEKNILVLENNAGEYFRVSESAVIGKQVKTIAFLGLLLKLFLSYYGTLILSVLTLAFCLYITFSRINYENTKEGKDLLRRYRKEHQEQRQRDRLLKNLRNGGAIDYMAQSTLSGDFDENYNKLMGYDLIVGGTIKEKYKYLLTKFHDGILSKKKLSKVDKVHITNLFELMCAPKEFDLDMQYMLSDLALVSKLEDFDIESFRDSVFSFLRADLDSQSQLNFISILYLVLTKNRELRVEDMRIIIEEFMRKLSTATDSDAKMALNYAKNGLKLIK